VVKAAQKELCGKDARNFVAFLRKSSQIFEAVDVCCDASTNQHRVFIRQLKLIDDATCQLVESQIHQNIDQWEDLVLVSDRYEIANGFQIFVEGIAEELIACFDVVHWTKLQQC